MGENFFIMSLGFYFHPPAACELFIGTYKEDEQWMNLHYLRHGFLQPLTLFTIKSIVGSYVGNTVIYILFENDGNYLKCTDEIFIIIIPFI